MHVQSLNLHSSVLKLSLSPTMDNSVQHILYYVHVHSGGLFRGAPPRTLPIFTKKIIATEVSYLRIAEMSAHAA